jgi:hypothetical protein
VEPLKLKPHVESPVQAVQSLLVGYSLLIFQYIRSYLSTYMFYWLSYDTARFSKRRSDFNRFEVDTFHWFNLMISS